MAHPSGEAGVEERKALESTELLRGTQLQQQPGGRKAPREADESYGEQGRRMAGTLMKKTSQDGEPDLCSQQHYSQ